MTRQNARRWPASRRPSRLPNRHNPPWIPSLLSAQRPIPPWLAHRGRHPPQQPWNVDADRVMVISTPTTTGRSVSVRKSVSSLVVTSSPAPRPPRRWRSALCARVPQPDVHPWARGRGHAPSVGGSPPRGHRRWAHPGSPRVPPRRWPPPAPHSDWDAVVYPPARPGSPPTPAPQTRQAGVEECG